MSVPPLPYLIRHGADGQAGYREGITDGKLSTLQQGFDEGFTLSTPLARRIGSLRGRATALLQFLSTTDSPVLENVREFIRDLERVKRDDVLPVDLEREAHEEEDRLARGEDGFELESTEKRDMEYLENALEGISSAATTSAVNGQGDVSGEALIAKLERRLADLGGTALRG